jgi:cold shock CspA family protein
MSESDHEQRGRIKKLVAERGYGFLATASGDLFFHAHALRGIAFDALQEGQSVRFTQTRDGQGRPRAKYVKLPSTDTTATEEG